MAGFGEIPIPKQFSSMGELADLMMAKRKMEQEKYLHELQNAQRAKEAEQTNEYRQGMLGISRSAEGRALKLQPYELAKLQAENAANQRFLAAQGVSGAAAPSPAPTDTSMLNQMIQSGNPEQPSRVPGSSPRVGIPPAIVAQHPDMDYQKRVAQNQVMPNPNSPMPSMQQQPGMPSQSQVLPQPQGNQPPQGSPFNQLQQRLNSGEEVLMRSSLPGKEGLDELAGQSRLGLKVPDVKTKIVDGIEYRTYPSGKQTALKVGPNEQEKAKIHREEAEIQEQAKANTKVSSDIRKSARELKSMHDRALKLRKMLEENPNLTGVTKGTMASANISQDKKLAEFIQTTRKLQADMGRYGSQRGGAQALKWAEKSKPGEFRSGKFNLGMINSIIEDAESDYENLNTEYTDMNQHSLPIKLHKSKQDESEKIHYLNGKKYKMENGEWHEIEGGK